MSTGLSYRSTNRVHIPLDCEPEDGDLGGLHPGEVFWRDHQIWLFEKGYMLRPRHRPGWVPSWLPGSGSPYFRYKDGVFNMVRKFIFYLNVSYKISCLLRMRRSCRMSLAFPIIHWWYSNESTTKCTLMRLRLGCISLKVPCFSLNGERNHPRGSI